MLRSRRTPERAVSNSEPGETETESSTARPWGAFSILKVVNDLKDLYSDLQAKSAARMPVEQAAGKQSRAKAPSLSNRRYDEMDGVYFRSNRLFTVNHYWYFATREGENKGPFQDRQQAELALATFIAERMNEEPGTQVAPINGAQNAELDEMVEEAQDLIQILRRKGQTGALVWAHRRIQALKQKGHRTRHPWRRIEVIEHLLHSV